MKLITLSEFNAKMTAADSMKPASTTKPDNKLRHGSYISLRFGMRSELWFLGLDLKTNSVIIECVG